MFVWVTQALAQADLESSNLIVGIDFTKSNEWTGARAFHQKSLHHLGDSQNPYEQAISIIGRTLSAFDEDNLIPCYGFGDASTHDQDVFSFYPDGRPCNGFEQVLGSTNQSTWTKSFAPIIQSAIRIVDNSCGQYHVLVIIADGQVIRSVDTGYDQLSPQEQNTMNAIAKASEYPLSIVLVGVSDGPWDMTHKFDDNIRSRAFDNFQVKITQLSPFGKKLLVSEVGSKIFVRCAFSVVILSPAAVEEELLVDFLFLHLETGHWVPATMKRELYILLLLVPLLPNILRTTEIIPCVTGIRKILHLDADTK
ncbi:hypothetical protein Dsin_012682 [Dipteronia sinensis]|uniref:Copine C-terminal domain-containing protein n=1 Tax=Dipteronia sinensis TaxID=43782 RepID=A0AAE0AJU6_9ROSI|nr:hypothetical protein Dsin_012682 [Dipteronia sinensis]